MQKTVSSAAAAEMFAVCNALFIAQRAELLQRGDQVLMQTDAMSAIHAFDGTRKAKAPDDLEAVSYLTKFVAAHDIRIDFRHVKGHTKHKEARFVTNNLCDKRAKEGMRQARKKLKESQT